MANILDVPLECFSLDVLGLGVIALSRTCKRFYNAYGDYVKTKYSNDMDLINKIVASTQYTNFILNHNILSISNTKECMDILRSVVSFTIQGKSFVDNKNSAKITKFYNIKCIVLWRWLLNNSRLNLFLDTIKVSIIRQLITIQSDLLHEFIRGYNLFNEDVKQWIINQILSNEKLHFHLQNIDFIPSEEDIMIATKMKDNNFINTLLDKVTKDSLQIKYFDLDNLGFLNKITLKKLLSKLIKNPTKIHWRKLSEAVLDAYNLELIQYLNNKNVLDVSKYNFDDLLNHIIKEEKLDLAKEVVPLLKLKYGNDLTAMKKYIITSIVPYLVNTDSIELMIAFFGETKEWEIDLSVNLMSFTSKNSKLKRRLTDIFTENVKSWQEEHQQHSDEEPKAKKNKTKL